MKILAKIIIVAAIFIAGFYFGTQQALSPIDDSAQINQEISSQIQSSLMIDFGDGKVKTFSNVILADGTTAFDFLKKVTTENNLKLDYKDYGAEMGVFVESIDGIGNDLGSDKFWQYWINNQYSEIGASSYKLKAGDSVEWKYIKGQIN